MGLGETEIYHLKLWLHQKRNWNLFTQEKNKTHKEAKNKPKWNSSIKKKTKPNTQTKKIRKKYNISGDLVVVHTWWCPKLLPCPVKCQTPPIRKRPKEREIVVSWRKPQWTFTSFLGSLHSIALMFLWLYHIICTISWETTDLLKCWSLFTLQLNLCFDWAYILLCAFFNKFWTLTSS